MVAYWKNVNILQAILKFLQVLKRPLYLQRFAYVRSGGPFALRMLWSVGTILWTGKCSKPKRLLLPSANCSNEPRAETPRVEGHDPVGGCSGRGLYVGISRADFAF
jgi:hypothetical protein